MNIFYWEVNRLQLIYGSTTVRCEGRNSLVLVGFPYVILSQDKADPY